EKSAEMDRIARARGHHRFEWVHRRLDGKEVPVEVAMSAVEIDGGPAMVVVWHDLTERKRAENELLRLGERLKDANGRLEAAHRRSQHGSMPPLPGGPRTSNISHSSTAS